MFELRGGVQWGSKEREGRDTDWTGGAKARHHSLDVISEIKCVLG